MATEIKVPTLGESVTSATVARWMKHEGEAVAADEPLVELETDKVTVEISAPSAGVLTSISAPEGSEVPVGALLAQSSGGYVVEVVGAGGTRRYVPVRPGLFDDASGLVQVSGALTPGQRVVVPAS